jgi:hypothetical protein
MGVVYKAEDVKLHRFVAPYPPKNVITAAGKVPSSLVWVLFSNSSGEEYLSAECNRHRL